ncbi:uncharacterized protein LOC101206114 [Cucumis sativus]|uniref:Uncharacterized protein n=1 Tax=Cucumis sativus TaxID=3659 RepID=A0A0A0K6K5_CUCSA|nr:uncharacterized protein LOC101206114 [Cucumis sativus]KGN45133.1 hypothetical protein Csa_016550 [Cucumis sativus]
MEPAKVDWKNVQWRFVEDELYEHINAPKWVDFTAIHDPVDDEAWFCRPDCKHPKTAEELLRVTPTKLTSPGYSTDTLQSSDRIGRDGKLKRRGPPQFSNNENQNPNSSTPPSHSAKATKAGIKSSAEKKPLMEDGQQKNNGAPSLKSTLSARNLFAGRDILNQITEFCNEIKRMAIRVRERENVKQQSAVENGVEGEKKFAEKEKEVSAKGLNDLEKKEKQRKPFGELSIEKSDGSISNSVKQKKRINTKSAANGENVLIPLDLERAWHKRDDNTLQIRTNPPSPQCFSSIRAPNKIPASKASRSRLKEKEMEEVKEVTKGEVSAERVKAISSVVEKEAKALDVLWFLKPCTLSN